MGMPSSEYWEGPCQATRAYAKAHRMRAEARDAERWSAGAYIYRALVAASPCFRDLTKDSSPKPYVERPFMSSAGGGAGADEERLRMEKNREYLQAFAARFNPRFG